MPNFNEIKGQEPAKRAIEIALAGRIKLMLYGPPGCGKTMLIDAVEQMVLNDLDGHFSEDSEKLAGLFYGRRPCPCGFYGHPIRECVCTIEEMRDFHWDWPVTQMYIHVPFVSYDKLRHQHEGEENEAIAKRIIGAWKILEDVPRADEIVIPNEGHALYKRAVDTLGLSAREVAESQYRALVIAALEGMTEISTAAVAEALQYRAPSYYMLVGSAATGDDS